MRVDKWLWAARFFKTRSLAVEAIGAGHITVNGERAKPAKTLKAGDVVEVRRPPITHVVVVKGFSERRGPASEAQKLYEETAESKAKREELVAQLRATPPSPFKGRPTKKDRRAYEKWFRGETDE